MFSSRTDAPRKAHLVLRTTKQAVYTWEDGDLNVAYVPVTTQVRPQTKRQKAKEDSGTLPVRPTLPQGVAFYEGWLDWQDVQEEQAIAQDGFFDYGDMGTWYNARKAGFTSTVEYRAFECEGKWTSESTRYDVRIAAIVDRDLPAKQKSLKEERREWIEREMRKGVLFPDLDPYTLEPIRTPGSRNVLATNLRPRVRRYV